MQYLDTLIAKRSAYKNFSTDVRTALNHAYLLICEDGIARERFLTLCAQRIFCSTACGECDVCRNIEEGNYLDATFYDGSTMKVPDVSALTESAMIRPVIGDRKVFLIDNADKLSPQAQNKLLKTYEEPPKYLTIIMACASENGILTTIKSRAKKLYFDNLTSKEITDYLIGDGADKKQADVAAAIGNGNLEKAEKFLNSESFGEIYDKTFDLMLNLNSSAKIPEYALSEAFSKENITITFDILEIILHDVMNISANSGMPLINDGREYDVKQIAKDYSAQSAAEALYAINEGRNLLNNYVSATSSAERVLFKILEAKFKWQ